VTDNDHLCAYKLNPERGRYVMIINSILNKRMYEQRKVEWGRNVSDEWRTNTQVKGNRGKGEYDIKATRVVNRAKMTYSVSGLKR